MSVSDSPLFHAEELCKCFHSGTEKIQILDNTQLAINRGEMMAIVGASGAGKTTLLQILGTLDTPDSGKIWFKGNDLTRLSEKNISQFRNRSVGFIFQFHHLLPEFSAIENVMMPGLIAGKTRDEMYDPARALLQQVELEHRIEHRVHELSGGEQQRSALARALIMQPDLLLADEPTGNLDARSGDIVFELIQSLCKELSLAAIMVTHNQTLARKMDIICTLKNGTLNITE